MQSARSRFIFLVAILSGMAIAILNTWPLSAVASSGATRLGEVGFLGPPGPLPNTKTMTAAQYGVYSFVSPQNYCHMARWIISGTVLGEYAHEPRPVLIKRGTPAKVVSMITTDCTLRGQHIDTLDQELAQVEVLGGVHEGEHRYVFLRDFYPKSAYAEYADTEKRLTVSIRKRPVALPHDWRYMKTFRSSVGSTSDDVWGPELAASLQSYCNGILNAQKLPANEVPSFDQMRRIEVGYDEFHNGELVQVVDGPTKEPCFFGTIWYKVRLLGPPARGGHKMGWVQAATLDIARSK